MWARCVWLQSVSHQRTKNWEETWFMYFFYFYRWKFGFLSTKLTRISNLHLFYLSHCDSFLICINRRCWLAVLGCSQQRVQSFKKLSHLALTFFFNLWVSQINLLIWLLILINSVNLLIKWSQISFHFSKFKITSFILFWHSQILNCKSKWRSRLHKSARGFAILDPWMIRTDKIRVSYR